MQSCMPCNLKNCPATSTALLGLCVHSMLKHVSCLFLCCTAKLAANTLHIYYLKANPAILEAYREYIVAVRYAIMPSMVRFANIALGIPNDRAALRGVMQLAAYWGLLGTSVTFFSLW